MHVCNQAQSRTVFFALIHSLELSGKMPFKDVGKAVQVNLNIIKHKYLSVMYSFLS